MVALCTKKRTSTLAGSMLRVNYPIFSPPALPQLPPFAPSRPHMQTLTITDDINMPESSSVGHKDYKLVGEIIYNWLGAVS
jgi:hypothetical protein